MSSSLQELAHLQIPLQNIVAATNSFSDENIIRKGRSGTFYKGQLLQTGQSIKIVARRLDRNAQFCAEVSLLSQLNHENILSIVGFCDEDGEKIIVNKYAAKGSLDQYLSGPTLSWIQRLQICLGVARALSYIHYGFGVIHRNIKSSKILLDENWEAKVGGFGLSISNRSHRLVLSEPCGTMGYVDQTYVETGGVTHRSDIYSLGVVLFEVLCGRKAWIRDEGGHQFLVELVQKHYEDGKLEEIIDPEMWKRMAPHSCTIFSDMAYRCLNKQRGRRPDIKKVVKSLEEALELQRERENLGSDLKRLNIQLKDILWATKNFSKARLIGSGTYGMVYKADLNTLDNKISSRIKRKNKDDMQKKDISVAIRRMFNRRDEQGFMAEIEMLTSCKHPNIVSLLGFCVEGPEQILVYEFPSNGSLDDYLGSTASNTTYLTWIQRITMCLGIAHGLNYLHTIMKDKEWIIHPEIKSANIFLYENWEPKIADFGLSRFHPATTLQISDIAGTEVYLDPEYKNTDKWKEESDIYSFGVLLFEILSGRLAYDEIYNVDDDKGLPSAVLRHFTEKILIELVDPKLMEEIDADNFSLNRGPDRNSLDTFLKIAYQCLAEVQTQRPTMEAVIKELQQALYYQENREESLKFSFQEISLATDNFNIKNLIGRGGLGSIYKGKVGHNFVSVQRLNRDVGVGFLSELEILHEYKHEKVISLVGYCDEMNEQITVYEYASRSSLDRYLRDNSLTWMKRLEICIDVVTGLDFLHGTVVKEEMVIHRDIKSANILLTGNWEAKIFGFGRSMKCSMNMEIDYIIDNAAGTYGYCDPLYLQSGKLTKESDIYSLGVVLFEILCGRLSIEINSVDKHDFLLELVRKYINKGNIIEIVFKGIKKQIVPESLTIFSDIAYQCLHRERAERPTASEVLAQLKKAFEVQEDYEIWNRKLPRDYEKLIQMSEFPKTYSSENKKDLFMMFSKGVLLQKGKRWFLLGNSGERNEMISAKMFLYKGRRRPKWRSVPKSRFSKVAEIVDISNLMIQIKIRTLFLSPGVNYGVHLIFKFLGPRKSLAKRMYVNLKFRKGNEKFHAYFATWREDEWMMIELFRFYNHKEDTDFEVLLESFSRCYSGSGVVYIEGIEFRATDNVKHEEIEMLKELQLTKSNSKTEDFILKKSGNYDEGGKLQFLLSKMQGPKEHMFFVKKVLHGTSDEEVSKSRPIVQFRFEGLTELLRQQVFYIKCKIKSEMLSSVTENMCYLVFKLSEKCCGLQCPVIVRDLHHWRKKQIEILYFRTPSEWNLHYTDRVPKRRIDGWMEVIVWKFDSTYELKNDELLVNLKLICYEETMFGLILRGLEIRPM